MCCYLRLHPDSQKKTRETSCFLAKEKKKKKTLVLLFTSRMPVVTRSIRDRSAVGRFPTVTLGFGEDEVEEKEEPQEDNVKEENACRQWLRKVCPCCCPQLDDDDITDTVVTGVDEPEKEGTNDDKPTDETDLEGD